MRTLRKRNADDNHVEPNRQGVNLMIRNTDNESNELVGHFIMFTCHETGSGV